jgi:putative ABC transport system substrate-binding protein
MSTDLAAKRLEMLSKAFSKTNRIGVLYNPREPATRLEMQETEAAATMLGVTLQPLAARHPDDLEPVFAAAKSERADALVVFTHGFAVLNRAPARLRRRRRTHVIWPGHRGVGEARGELR